MNAISVRNLRDPINLGLTRWRLTVRVDAVAEIGRYPVSEHPLIVTDSAWVGKMSRGTGDGTAEPVSLDQILRPERTQGKNKCCLTS